MTATHDPTPTEPAPTDPGGLPLLTREEWEFLVSDAHSETQFIDPAVPRIAASGPDWFADDWPEIKITRSFATVQLTRLNRSDAGALQYRHFRIGQQEFRVLRVLEREGHVAIVRCQVRPIAELKPTHDTGDDELTRRFDLWWYDEGSGMSPLPGEEACDHVKRVSRIAWLNGADVATHSRPPVVKTLPDGAQVIEPAESTLLVPALQPIRVTERKPRPEDCNEDGRCWAWRFFDPEEDDFGDFWQLIPCEWLGGFSRWTHWLPANAMPMPTASATKP